MQKTQKVSLFESIRSKKVIGETTIENWLKPDQHKDEVLKYRSAASGKEKAKILKKLPAITPAATFDECLDHMKVKAYTNLCFVKIHQKKLKRFGDLEKVKYQLAGRIPEIAYCGLSLSGKSLDVLIHVQTHDYLYNEALVKVLFSAGMDGMRVECKELTDTMVASYDPHPYINPDAQAMTFGEAFLEVKRQYQANVERLVRQVIESGVCLSEKEEDALSLEIAHVFGSEGRSLFHEFASRNSGGDVCDYEKLYEVHLNMSDGMCW